jgi:signal transduction histidine kinase
MELIALKNTGIRNAKLLETKTDLLLTLTGSAIKTVQNISTQLRPGMLDDLGILAAMEWQVEEFEKRSGIPCTLSLPDDDVIIDANISIALFRILQEALTNVARHAQAGRVTVVLSHSENGISLSITDDGIGIDSAVATKPTSLGLLGIRERLHPFGGTCRIEAASGGGTTVDIFVPART